MGTLAAGKIHPWEKNKFSKLTFDWADPKNPGTGKVSVKNGSGAATSYTVPQDDIALIKTEAGSMTNNTDKTIKYDLT